MFTVELYAGIRRAVMVDGLSRREAAKRFDVHRNTISKMLQFSVPPPIGLARIWWRGFHSMMAISASNDTGDLYPREECRQRRL
jgi:hypothetical protein